MRPYTVSELAVLAGVTVRTLHHYDQIGLLEPSARTRAGYRLYLEPALLRLQQILFYKELDVPLDKIREILDDPAFDQVEALTQHRQQLQARAERLTHLLNTIDRTIKHLTEEEMPLTDAELYEGFTPEQIDELKREVGERYDPERVAEANRRVSRMSKTEWQAVRAEGDTISREMAALMDRDPGDAEVQTLMARQHAWIENFYEAPAELFRGLGELYAGDPRFRETYDKYAEGLADFLRAAMAHYAEHSLGG
jgi:DNA-binding transcriptional MerR regulator